MSSAICTLFEGDYHYGVATLVNSVSKLGFRGDIYAGYKGDLPLWANHARDVEKVGWADFKTLNVLEGVQIHFIRLETNYHLTNYKPDFMLLLWSGVADGVDIMFYFDPDIVLIAPWRFMEEWAGCGIALCEDVNSPLEQFHPKRVAWRKYFLKYEINLKHKNSIYVNGGFIGLDVRDISFLKKWKDIQELISPAIGGLKKSKLRGEQLPIESSGPFAPFSSTDQDALNVTVEVYDALYSFIGKEAMGFEDGATVMAHALGQPKPWNINPIEQFLDGRVPRLAHKKYWETVNNPIITYSKMKARRKLLLIKLAAFLGRFYSRF